MCWCSGCVHGTCLEGVLARCVRGFWSRGWGGGLIWVIVFGLQKSSSLLNPDEITGMRILIALSKLVKKGSANCLDIEDRIKHIRKNLHKYPNNYLQAIKGHSYVVKELVLAQPHPARVMVQQDTILHMCVKHNQLEVLIPRVAFWQDDSTNNDPRHMAGYAIMAQSL
nr:ankyrin repeat-containing domain, PGG domain protein [Tanacetum cinerariifolium]